MKNQKDKKQYRGTRSSWEQGKKLDAVKPPRKRAAGCIFPKCSECPLPDCRSD